jgi:hypothetical protein
MRKDFIPAALLLGAACLIAGAAAQVDWRGVWIYDVKPWFQWDGKPASEPVGEELRVEREPIRYGAR